MEEKAKAEDKIGMSETWLRKHRLIYDGATRHPLIISICDGTINIASFKTWLAQDYLFVRAFVPFAASVLIKAWKESDCRGDMEVILGGVASLEDEISWFKAEANKWGISLSDVVPQPPNKNYYRLLESLMTFWAIEAVYQESFAHCIEEGSKIPPELKETCARWGNEAFGKYCQSLLNIANRRLQKASDEELKKAEFMLLSVLEHEVEFWNMSCGNKNRVNQNLGNRRNNEGILLLCKISNMSLKLVFLFKSTFHLPFSENGCSLVVRIPRCGRGDLGSNPSSHTLLFHLRIF
ncbi:putative bifunctional TENA-E protein [Glycine soja]|uniref:Putative bifunctional TENA-E protein n=1 Tax=Glycine soja TaxID=3848 RepID=A0A445K122_GLYSO|nr:putative bifunctional TENA-E protein [Glycine soja]